MEAQWGLQDGHWGRQVAAGDSKGPMIESTRHANEGDGKRPWSIGVAFVELCSV